MDQRILWWYFLTITNQGRYCQNQRKLLEEARNVENRKVLHIAQTEYKKILAFLVDVLATESLVWLV